MTETTRIVTTAFDIKTKQSKILADENIESLIPYQKCPSFQLQRLFYSEDNPLTLETRHLDKPYDINLPERAIQFLKIRMPTKAEITADLLRAGEPIPEDWHKFNLHRTESIDYIYILSGNITCIVGEKEFELSSGDFLVQIGPEHTWINDHDEPCYVLCVMVGTPTPEGIERAQTTF
jgi:mannose-6-phosphate isomerase-like protein (cupin superfamily)